MHEIKASLLIILVIGYVSIDITYNCMYISMYIIAFTFNIPLESYTCYYYRLARYYHPHLIVEETN